MKKKMLIVNDTLFAGGVEKLMYDLVMEWYKDYDITILSESKDSKFHKVYPKSVKNITYGCKLSLAHLKGLRKYNERLKTYVRERAFQKASDMNFDIVLAMKEGFITKYCEKIKAGRKLMWVHLDYRNAYWTRSAFESGEEEVRCMRTYNNVICVSEYIKKTIQERIGDPGNLTVRYNPINQKMILDMAKESVTDIPTNTDKIRFVSVGRLHYQKGYDLLVKACSILNYEGYKDRYEVLVIGEGEMDHELHKQLKEQGVYNMSFLGFRSNPYKYLKLADWFISSSRYEGYSLVSQEAAILDIPIIATNVSGVAELLGDDYRYGIVNDISPEGIADSMRRVIEDVSLKEKYKKLIVERKEIIDFDSRVDDITKLF